MIQIQTNGLAYMNIMAALMWCDIPKGNDRFSYISILVKVFSNPADGSASQMLDLSDAEVEFLGRLGVKLQ